MSGGLVTAAYIVAAILFIFSLAGLSKHETSRRGNNFGIAGMAIALIATILDRIRVMLAGSCWRWSLVGQLVSVWRRKLK